MEENSFELIKDKNFPFLLCPQCKKNIILIVSLEKGIISYRCPCSAHLIRVKLEEFIKVIELIESENQKCYRHKEHTANSYCEICKKYMCDFCDSYHSEFQPEHKTEKIEKNLNNICKVHKQQEKNFYCRTCDVDLCENCKNTTHKNHPVITMKEFYAKTLKLVDFKSCKEMTEAFLGRFEEIQLFKEKQINFLNVLTNQILGIIEAINKTYDEAIKENYLNMALKKIVTDAYYNINEKISCPPFCSIKNAVELKDMKYYSSTPTSTITSFASSVGHMNITQERKTYFSNENESKFISKQSQIQKEIIDFEKEACKYIQEKKTVYFTQRRTKHLQTLYSKSLFSHFLVKKNFFNPVKLKNPITGFNKILVIEELSNGHMALGYDDKKIRIFSFFTKEVLGILEGHTGAIMSLCQLRNEHLLSGSTNVSSGGSIREWDLQKYQLVRTIANYPGNIVAIKQFFTNDLIAIASSVPMTIFITHPNMELKTSISTGTSLSNLMLIMNPSQYLVIVSNFDYQRKSQFIKVYKLDEEVRSIVVLEKKGQVNGLSQFKEENKIFFNDGKAVILYNIDTKTEEINFNISLGGLTLNPSPITKRFGALHQNWNTGGIRTQTNIGVKSLELIGNGKFCVGLQGIVEVYDYEKQQKETVVGLLVNQNVDIIYKKRDGQILCICSQNLFLIN